MKHLPYTALALATVLLLSGGTPVFSGGPQDSPPDAGWENRIRGLVEQLGDDDYQQREAAQRALLEEGDRILPVLTELGTPTDPEIRSRLQRIRYQLEGFLADINRRLAAMPEIEYDSRRPLPEDLKQLVELYQPRSGDYLLSIIGKADDPLNRQATNAFVQTWESMTAEQILAYLKLTMTLYAKPRQQYPQGVDAGIEMGYLIRFGWGGWPAEGDFKLRTTTTHFLDGQPYSKPFAYQGPMAGTGWIRTKDLTPGKHSFHLVTQYEFDLNGHTHTGQAQSAAHQFEMVGADAPDDLLAPTSAELDQLVRNALRFSEVQAVIRDGRPQIRVDVGDQVPEPDPWEPQITWHSGDGRSGSLHMPLWELSEELPVDLCFEVQLRMEETGEVFAASPLVVIKWNKSSGYIMPDRSREFGGGKTGLIPVRIVLKPSRATALSDTRVTSYYPGTITSESLRAKVVHD